MRPMATAETPRAINILQCIDPRLLDSSTLCSRVKPRYPSLYWLHCVDQGLFLAAPVELKGVTYVPPNRYEWKELRQFPAIFKEILRDKSSCTTSFYNLNQNVLQGNNISRAQCTPEEAQVPSDTLLFVSQDLILITNDRMSLAVYL